MNHIIINYKYNIYMKGLLFMYQINFNKPIHVHFIGIGGISMSGLAQILLGAGFLISGSDAKKSPLTQHLSDMGCLLYTYDDPD